MEPIRFITQIRYWDPDRGSGLSVADVPAEKIDAFGGLKQQRAQGMVNGTAFTSRVMPAGGGRLALSVTKAMMQGAKVGVGDEAAFEFTSVGRDETT
jgi:hypothetical protein